MPMVDALIISVICVAFVGFGLVLAWAEYQTRHLGPYAQKSDPNRHRSGSTITRHASQQTHRPPAKAA